MLFSLFFCVVDKRCLRETSLAFAASILEHKTTTIQAKMQSNVDVLNVVVVFAFVVLQISRILGKARYSQYAKQNLKVVLLPALAYMNFAGFSISHHG